MTIGEEEGVGEERIEYMSKEEDKVNNTSEGILSVPIPTLINQSVGHIPRLRMKNQNITLRLPMFHGMGKDNVEKHWFRCEAIWYLKRITNKESRISQLETSFRDKSLTWYMKYKETRPVG
jgi:hypothetical protein